MELYSIYSQYQWTILLSMGLYNMYFFHATLCFIRHIYLLHVVINYSFLLLQVFHFMNMPVILFSVVIGTWIVSKSGATMTCAAINMLSMSFGEHVSTFLLGYTRKWG